MSPQSNFLYIQPSPVPVPLFPLLVVESTLEILRAPMDSIKLPLIPQRKFVPIKITGKSNIHYFIKTMFKWNSNNPDKIKMKRTQWWGIKIVRIITNYRLTENIETINIRLVIKDPSKKSIMFFNSLPGIEHLNQMEEQNIKYKYIYGRNGYEDQKKLTPGNLPMIK